MSKEASPKVLEAVNAWQDGHKTGTIAAFRFAYTHTRGEIAAEFRRRYPGEELTPDGSTEEPEQTDDDEPRPNSPEDVGYRAREPESPKKKPDLGDLGPLGQRLLDKSSAIEW